MRKICNPRNFKCHVSPHEFLQAVVLASERRFKITSQSDPFDFLAWLLNALHMRLKGNKKHTIITKTLQGKLRITSRKLPPTESQAVVDGVTIDPNDDEYKATSKDSPFLILPLDVPPPPLFSDEQEANIIPQVPLFELFNKYDGITEKEDKTYKDIFIKKYQLLALPSTLILHIKRFTKNTFFVEKNPTIVNFPIKNLILKDYLSAMEEGQLIVGDYKYDLVANIVHEGLPGAGKGTYEAHVIHKGVNQWFKTQDLHVDEILPQMITLSTSYVQVWERQPDAL